jgi:16S rRNA (uracil1498-N3)-methyltransferase
MERRLVAHPRGNPLSEINLAVPISTRLAIGPEGGFTESEIELAVREGWQLVDLGPRILRVETAAVALSAALALLNPSVAPR